MIIDFWNDLIEMDDDSFAYLIDDTGRLVTMWKRYPEFENIESDKFYEDGDDYWYILFLPRSE